MGICGCELKWEKLGEVGSERVKRKHGDERGGEGKKRERVVGQQRGYGKGIGRWDDGKEADRISGCGECSVLGGQGEGLGKSGVRGWRGR